MKNDTIKLLESIQNNINEGWKYTKSELNSFWKDKTESVGFDGPEDWDSSTIADILDDIHDYLAHESYIRDIEDVNAEYNRIIPILIQNGINYGIDEKALKKAAQYFDEKYNKRIKPTVNPWE